MINFRSAFIAITFGLFHSAHGQWDVRVFTGPQLDNVTFKKPDVSDRSGSARTEDAYGTGFGLHFGTSATFGNGVARMSLGLLLSTQETNASYTSIHSYQAPGGSSRSEVQGDLRLRSLIMEYPILILIGRNSAVQGNVGIAPWHLLRADHQDRGVRTITATVYTFDPVTNTEYFHITDKDITRFTRNGVAFQFGMTARIKQIFSLQTSCSIFLSSIYRDHQPFNGHHTFLRLAVGYVLVKTSDQEL